MPFILINSIIEPVQWTLSYFESHHSPWDKCSLTFSWVFKIFLFLCLIYLEFILASSFSKLHFLHSETTMIHYWENLLKVTQRFLKSKAFSKWFHYSGPFTQPVISWVDPNSNLVSTLTPNVEHRCTGKKVHSS